MWLVRHVDGRALGIVTSGVGVVGLDSKRQLTESFLHLAQLVERAPAALRRRRGAAATIGRGRPRQARRR